jgi:Ubiquitin-activating enzyme E1 four-helix bundle
MFELDVDSTSWGPYVRGGIVAQVKECKEISFKPLREALEDPGEFLLSDFSKMERSGILHLGFQALDAFMVCPEARHTGCHDVCCHGLCYLLAVIILFAVIIPAAIFLVSSTLVTIIPLCHNCCYFRYHHYQ